MASVQDLPFNLKLLLPRAEQLKGLKPVTDLSIFESSTHNFHPQGLFSVEIFGKVGTAERNRTFSYIKLPVPIFHPVLFKAIVELKEFYLSIMSQTRYGVWDEKTRDILPSNPIDGDTGMEFFTRCFPKIVFEERDSDKRAFNIRLIEHYRDNAQMRYLLVLPAGLRDYEITPDGRPEEGDVNTLYRKVLSLSNLVQEDTAQKAPESVDSIRFNLQLAVNDIYNYFRSLLEGKSKFIQSKWVSRKVFNSTRNVASTITNDIDEADDVTLLRANEVAVGLHQYAKASMPLSIHHLRERFLRDAFSEDHSVAHLINRKTLQVERVHIHPQTYDQWMSAEGLEALIAHFGSRDIRHDPVIIEDHYLALVYRGPDKTFRVFRNIDELPEGFDRKDVGPMTLTELFYLSLYHDSDTIPAYITRYPISSYGSIYPAYTHLKTTLPSEVRYELDDQWQRTDRAARAYPVIGADFFDTIAPHQSHLQRLGLDYDGDVISYFCVLTEEAKAEIAKKLQSANYYVDPTGKMYFSASTDTIDYVLGYLTK